MACVHWRLLQNSRSLGVLRRSSETNCSFQTGDSSSGYQQYCDTDTRSQGQNATDKKKTSAITTNISASQLCNDSGTLSLIIIISGFLFEIGRRWKLKRQESKLCTAYVSGQTRTCTVAITAGVIFANVKVTCKSISGIRSTVAAAAGGEILYQELRLPRSWKTWLQLCKFFSKTAIAKNCSFLKGSMF